MAYIHQYYLLTLYVKCTNKIVLTQDPCSQLLCLSHTCMEETNKKCGRNLMLSKTMFCHYS